MNTDYKEAIDFVITIGSYPAFSRKKNNQLVTFKGGREWYWTAKTEQELLNLKVLDVVLNSKATKELLEIQQNGITERSVILFRRHYGVDCRELLKNAEYLELIPRFADTAYDSFYKRWFCNVKTEDFRNCPEALVLKVHKPQYTKTPSGEITVISSRVIVYWYNSASLLLDNLTEDQKWKVKQTILYAMAQYPTFQKLEIAIEEYSTEIHYDWEHHNTLVCRLVKITKEMQ